MKTKIIILLSVIIVLLLIFNKRDVVKTVTKIEYIQDESKVINTKPKDVKLIRIKVPVKSTDTIIENDTIEKIVYKDKEVKKYTYVDSLKNGTIKSTILSDNIYKRDVQLFTNTARETTTKTIVQPQLFIGGSVGIGMNKQIERTSINLFYNHKNKFLLGGGVGYDVNIKEPYLNITLGIPLN